MTIVVLGGGIVRNCYLPKYVQERLKKAWQIFKKNEKAKILVCGKYSFLYPKNKPPQKTEAEIMRDHLLKLGAPKEKIFLEQKSQDTITNAYFAKTLYFIPKKEQTAKIITSDFHLQRVKFIFSKVFGKEYRLKFISAPSFLTKERKKRIEKRQKEVLKRTKILLKEMRDGNHNFLKSRKNKLKQFYQEKRPSWVKQFIAEE